MSINKALGDPSAEALTLTDIGLTHTSLGEEEQALSLYNQALPLLKAVGHRSGQARTLHSIGLAYASLGEHEKALSFFNQALPIRKIVGDRPGQGLTLNHIGLTLKDLDQPQLAIAFLKNSVNTYENIRQDITGLPLEQQESYKETIAETYRTLRTC